MYLREFAEKSLVTVNKNLNPKLWSDNEIKPEVKEKLMAVAEKFVEFIGVDIQVEDITVTGSNANYTWTEHSDLDLHIIVPGTPTDAERELYTAKKALWGETRDIKIKGLPVECYVQGSKEKHHSTGVYSLVNDEWITEPKKVKPKVDDQAIKAKQQSLHWVIAHALDSDNLDRLNEIKKKITQMRKSGLERAGEWSTENLVFKQLRNQGLIDRLSDRIRELEDQQLSLEQAQPLN
jgi:predicted nucleotidyltransferase